MFRNYKSIDILGNEILTILLIISQFFFKFNIFIMKIKFYIYNEKKKMKSKL